MPTVTQWPDDLPGVSLVSGYNDTIGDGRTLSQVSAGVGKRRAFWSGVRSMSLQINMTPNQWMALKAFWDATGYGTQTFWLRDASTDQQPLTLAEDASSYLLTEDGTPILFDSWQLCQFSQQPPQVAEAYSTAYWKVQVALDVLA